MEPAAASSGSRINGRSTGHGPGNGGAHNPGNTGRTPAAPDPRRTGHGRIRGHGSAGGSTGDSPGGDGGTGRGRIGGDGSSGGSSIGPRLSDRREMGSRGWSLRRLDLAYKFLISKKLASKEKG